MVLVRFSIQELANHVHGSNATGKKRIFERQLDRDFPKGVGYVEATHNGGFRAVSKDESNVINFPSHKFTKIVRSFPA